MFTRAARHIGRAVGLSAALLLSLLLAERVAPPLVLRITPHLWNAKLASEVLWGHINGPDEKVGVSQFVAFLVTMVLVVGCTTAYAALRGLGERRRVLRRALPVVDVGVALVAVALAARESRFEAGFALKVLGIGVALLVAQTGATPEAHESSDRMRAAFVLCVEAMALGWGLYLCGPESEAWLLPWVGLGLLVTAALRVGSVRTGRDARRDVVAGAVFLALPLVGLWRNPSSGWAEGAIAIAIATWFVSGRNRPSFARPFPDLLVIAAGTTLSLLAWLPYRFRELVDENQRQHEAQHLGWIASAAFGKLLFADAGLMYGPVREYALALLAATSGGLTIDHVRLAHIVLNIVGTALFIAAGWVLSGRRIWLLALWCCLLVTRSPLRFFLDYPNDLNFGWADVARPASAAFVVWGALAAAERVDLRRRSLVPLAGWGSATGVAALYSQDSGIAAVGAVGIALFADAMLRRRGLSLRERFYRAGRTLGAFLGGTGGLLALFSLMYVALGRGRRLLDAWHFLAEVGSGVFGASVYPLTINDFRSEDSLFGSAGFFAGPRTDYLLPPAILVVGAAAMVGAIFFRRWSARTTQVAGLFLLSCAVFRYALYRADMWHITGGAIPAWLLAVALIADACSVRIRLHPLRASGFSPGLVLFPLLAVYGATWQERGTGLLSLRAKRVLAGEEHASRGTAPSSPLARAGDANISPHTLRLVEYIRAHTSRSEPIWVVTNFITGGEIYFLADRRDATRYDVWSEAITHREFRITLEDIQRDPPVLIVGHGWREYSPEITDYVNQNWRLVDTVDGVDMRRYDPAHTLATAAPPP